MCVHDKHNSVSAVYAPNRSNALNHFQSCQHASNDVNFHETCFLSDNKLMLHLRATISGRRRFFYRHTAAVLWYFYLVVQAFRSLD